MLNMKIQELINRKYLSELLSEYVSKYVREHVRAHLNLNQIIDDVFHLRQTQIKKLIKNDI